VTERAGTASLGTPVVTPTEMAAIDAAAPEPTEVLIERAGAAVARTARSLLGGTYGRSVVVVAGKGNNGNDGRAAAARLGRAGARVTVIDAIDAPAQFPPCDLIIDAAFGTGLRGSWKAPRMPADGSPPVLAVDIPSGVDGTTGEVADTSEPLPAAVTVTFAAAKPGLLFAPGSSLVGAISVADIGLDVSTATITLLDDAGVAANWPQRGVSDHKWNSAVWAVAGGPGMDGAAALVCAGAQRSGAGYVRLSTPGVTPDAATPAGRVPVEVVRTALPTGGWWPLMAPDVGRFGAVVVGNGLGSGVDPGDVAGIVTACPVPVVVDADGLRLLAASGLVHHGALGAHVVLTPHDGEFAALSGHPPGSDRIAATRALARSTGAVVLLKGSTTVVAAPTGETLLSTSGDARLATAGTGDVLAGMVASLCAQGVSPFHAAAMAAYGHGRAADLGWAVGLVASDLPGLVPAAVAAMGVALPGAPPDTDDDGQELTC